MPQFILKCNSSAKTQTKIVLYVSETFSNFSFFCIHSLYLLFISHVLCRFPLFFFASLHSLFVPFIKIHSTERHDENKMNGFNPASTITNTFRCCISLCTHNKSISSNYKRKQKMFCFQILCCVSYNYCYFGK